MTDDVVTVISSMYALNGGSRIPDFTLGPRHSTSADLIIIFIAREKRVAYIVHPVIIPLSSLCQSNVLVPDVTLRLKLL